MEADSLWCVEGIISVSDGRRVSYWVSGSSTVSLL